MLPSRSDDASLVCDSWGCWHDEPLRWPPQTPADLADGSLVVASSSPRDGVAVIRAVGEVDLLTARGWRHLLHAGLGMVCGSAPPLLALSRASAVSSLGARTTPRLVCDLSPVTFLGATGCGVLVELARLAEVSGVELRVVATSHSVVRLLRLTGLDRCLDVGPGLEQAVRSGRPTAES